MQKNFKIKQDFIPRGDQKNAINFLSQGVEKKIKGQTLLGVTGSGKTFTMAKVIEKVQKPSLVIAHNKTLAAQLASEFEEFFPENSVEYFVSYYDYYQPEAYIPRSDTYIEKESDMNQEIDRLRHSATRSILTRPDTIIVSSVSCIYGLGSPEEYSSVVLSLECGKELGMRKIIRKLIDMYYERNDMELGRGRFRILGDTLEIMPSYEDLSIRVEFFGDEIDKINQIDPLTGEILEQLKNIDIFPRKHFVTPENSLKEALKDIEKELDIRVNELKENNKLLEAQRLYERTNYDLEMLRETGTCPGVENYSQPLGRRAKGSPPWTLLDYFPEDYLIFIDESHITIPQIRGMYKGDFSRKSTLVDFGFRLPSAKDNRPLSFEEFEEKINQIIFVSATPGEYENDYEAQRVEQIIRPTGLIEPQIIIKPTKNQVDDLIEEIRITIEKKERVLVTTLTKKMAEELSEYLSEIEIKVHYLHSEIQTIERVEILRDLRLGIYDVIVGINLLREGLDLPEVSTVAILDADKEGYLRSSTSLIQTVGRAARNVNGKVIMYADKITKSMDYAINETNRRRKIQIDHNNKHDIVPKSIVKEVRDITGKINSDNEKNISSSIISKIDNNNISKKEIVKSIKSLEKEMRIAAKNLEFEKAAFIRDEIQEIRKISKAI
ncbi:MAG: excinuclease ABC subunit B [Chloroflexi bacterium]|nr:excinuclease ABC subunit B [Chloroflexota bacterium]